jgi:autophagy-related protein 9
VYARWKFRDFNELPHVLQERLRLSEKYASEYMSQFTSHWVSTLSKFVAFVMSTFLGILFAMTLLNDVTLFNLEITKGHSTFWFMGIFSTVLLLARGLEVQSTVFYPKKKMEKLAKYIHYIPNEWVENATKNETKYKMGRFFEFRFMSLVKELFGLIINPLIIWMNIDSKVPHIVDFMRDYTVRHPKLGYVCQFSVFDNYADNPMLSSTHLEPDSPNSVKLQMSIQNFNERNPLTSQNVLDESMFSDTMNVNIAPTSGAGMGASMRPNFGQSAFGNDQQSILRQFGAPRDLRANQSMFVTQRQSPKQPVAGEMHRVQSFDITVPMNPNIMNSTFLENMGGSSPPSSPPKNNSGSGGGLPSHYQYAFTKEL